MQKEGFQLCFTLDTVAVANLRLNILMAYILRLLINGPKNIDLFPALKYAKSWHRAGKYLTDDLLHQNTQPTDAVADDDTEGTSSKIYIQDIRYFLMEATFFSIK